MRAAAQRPMTADDGALDGSGQAGVDPVAGEEQAGHAGSASRGRGGWPGATEKVALLLADDDRARSSGADAPPGSAVRQLGQRQVDQLLVAARRPPPRRRSTPATDARRRSPKSARLSNTHCIVRPGRPTNARRSRRDRTRVDGDDRRGVGPSAASRTRPSAAGRSGSTVRQRVPRHRADDGAAPSAARRGRDTWRPRHASRGLRRRAPRRRAASMNARAGMRVQLVQRLARQRRARRRARLRPNIGRARRQTTRPPPRRSAGSARPPPAAPTAARSAGASDRAGRATRERCCVPPADRKVRPAHQRAPRAFAALTVDRASRARSTSSRRPAGAAATAAPGRRDATSVRRGR